MSINNYCSEIPNSQTSIITLFNRLGSARVINKIGLQSVYWQMLAKPEEIQKNVFKTR